MMLPAADWGRVELEYEPATWLRVDEFGRMDPATEKPPPVESED